MSNFTFLKDRWPILENLGKLAERNLFIDSNTTFIKCGIFGETLVKYMVSMEEVDETLIQHDNNHNNRIKLLKKEDLIPDDIDNILHMLRIKRNNAAHDGYENIEKAKIQLELTYKLAVWFMQTYGSWDFEPEGFVMPKENEDNEKLSDITKEYEEKLKVLEEELKELKAQEKDKEELEKRKLQGKKASRRIEYTEAETRRIIDEQLQGAGWYSPEKLESMLSENIEEANKTLDELSFDFLQSENSIGLRDYQVKAIKAIEQAIIEGRKTALIAMATGTGKTRTVLGLIYRLIKTKRYRRILFLVDRTSLGTQALDTFKEVKIEDLKTLNQIYNINSLEEKLIDKETKIHIATVQAMVKRIMYNEDESNIPSVGDYDCVIIDEAHRGYTLDKEMNSSEVHWRDNRDFLSKYKKVIDYFDAFKVALTATPALHTTMIFGKPVYNYSYREAVIDGYLVDHEPPHLIQTELTKEGIHYKKGDRVAKYNKYTGELINGAELEDDVDFDIDQFNKKIIVESHTKAALKEVAKYIDPEGDKGKTLIFAASDSHADMIVRVLKDIYKETMGRVDDDSIMKITGSVKDPELYIKRFKNEIYPNVAVTVDLLSTGIDVPKIDKIVFLRRVKSRILYEQMLGRATRLCDEIDKTHFEIFDCVGLYEVLDDVTNMKPVVVGGNTSFKVLKESLERTEEVEEKKETINKIVAKLQRKKKLLKEKERLIFKNFSNNRTPEEFINDLKNIDTDKAVREIINNNALIEYLDQSSRTEEIIIVSDREDKVISHTRGYGKGKKPEDYLEEFKEYINENKNLIPALEVVCTRPQELTKESLKQLKSILDDKGFSEEYLKTAWKDLKNEDIVADIIAFIRQQALGSPLESNEERVEKAVARIKKEYYLTKPQINWLNRIEKAMLKDIVIDKATLDTGSFKSQGGGFTRLNKIFDGELEDILSKLKTYMFEDRDIS